MIHVRLSIIAGLLAACLSLVARVPSVSAQEKLVNLNTASAAQLGDLKGIGKAKAQGIVTYREKNGPFKSVDELRQVSGIGEKLLEKLRPHITVAATGAAPAAASMAAKH